jgi:hypothetical protein
MIQLLFLGQQS